MIDCVTYPVSPGRPEFTVIMLEPDREDLRPGCKPHDSGARARPMTSPGDQTGHAGAMPVSVLLCAPAFFGEVLAAQDLSLEIGM
ncbi:hypothetical protein AN218_29695 [Streptomyces nanshensis]|uniref:Uncharacterized protein n=1 Tax=Streptomyces nanshensis TaxID=518642 RepID=A0A1E7KT03_9ACTN|nr:hypothetical protein AN218_29695 [Streptomyces nanshensis]